MNYDLTGGNPNKPMPIMDNYVRDDTGGQIYSDQNVSGNAAEVNERLDVNGSDNKPYPQERNFVRDNDIDTNPNIGVQSSVVTQMETGNVTNQFGQIKYARREGAKSIYKDVTRETENDKAASAKAEGSTIYEDCDESEESLGI